MIPKTEIYIEPSRAKVSLQYGSEVTTVEVEIDSMAKRRVISSINDLICALSVMRSDNV